MDLTESEARELFPTGRGSDVEDAAFESHVYVVRTRDGWAIEYDGEAIVSDEIDWSVFAEPDRKF